MTFVPYHHKDQTSAVMGGFLSSLSKNTTSQKDEAQRVMVRQKQVKSLVAAGLIDEASAEALVPTPGLSP